MVKLPIVSMLNYILARNINPFTPKSDHFQISPAASPEILHHTVWRTWLVIAYSDKRWLYYQFSLPRNIHSILKGWKNVLFDSSPARNQAKLTKTSSWQSETLLSTQQSSRTLLAGKNWSLLSRMPVGWGEGCIVLGWGRSTVVGSGYF